MPPFIEAACFNPASARTAAHFGASRIELCSNRAAGGLTPSLSDFQSLKSDPSIKIPIYVMIRPHDIGFTYSGDELAQMENEIGMFRDAGADGFVFGVLNPEGKVAYSQNTTLIYKADGKPCTFHRAFDQIAGNDMEEQFEVLIKCGFKAVLASGGKGSAVEGKAMLKNLVQRAGNSIDVIVGGGVRSENVEMLKDETGAKLWHTGAVEDIGMMKLLLEGRELGLSLSEMEGFGFSDISSVRGGEGGESGAGVETKGNALSQEDELWREPLRRHPSW